MFREKYKAAFSHVNGDRTQIDKIFSIAEQETTPQKAKIYSFRYLGTLAAAIAIVLVVAMYPNFSDFLGAEDKEYEPVGIVNYGSEKSWDNTVITGSAPDEPTSGAVNRTSDLAPEDTKETKNIVAAENKKASSEEESNTFVADKSAEYTSDSASVPMMAMQVPSSDEAGIEEYVTDDVMLTKKAASGGSSAPYVMIDEYSVDLGDEKFVAVSAYNSHNEIEAVLENVGVTADGYKMNITSESGNVLIVYAEKNGIFYKLSANGLNNDELIDFINEKL